MSASPRALCAALDRGLLEGAVVEVTGETAHHLARVVRVREGDALELFDGRGVRARARVARIDARGARGAVRVAVVLTEPAGPGVGADAAGVYWLQGVPKGDKLEAVVRQATELGVAALRPVHTARSVPRPRDARGEEARTARLHAVAVAAATQCGRADVPEVAPAVGLAEALSELPLEAALRIVPWEEGGEPLGAVLAHAPAERGPCVVLVGPEGGLEGDEVALCRAHGFRPVSLGPRVLRTETVAPALLAMLSLARGDLRG